MELSFENVYKRFGDTQALCGVTFRAHSGAPFGLLGRNGAGKTTCMRIIMNIFEPDSGRVLADGVPLARSGAKLGYLPEERGLYRRMSVGEQLEYFARLRGMRKNDAHSAVIRSLERLDMGDAYSKKVETLSKGNQQRVQLALAFVNNPDIVILDEPFSGLDPVNALRLRDFAAEEAGRGRLIIFSSHQMNVVEDFCEDILILKKGSAVLSGRLSEIKAAAPHRDVRICAANMAGARDIAAQYGTVTDQKDGILLRLNHPEQRGALLGELVGGGADISVFETVEPSLESIFVSCASDDDGGDAQ